MIRRPSPEQLERIRELTFEGKSTNQIQRTLSQEGLGLRRTVMLGYIREIKNQQSKPNAFLYTPRKYRQLRRSPFRAKRLYHPKLGWGNKQAGACGSVHGRERRIQVYGIGAQIYKVMKIVSFHPPKVNFLTIDARELLNDPSYYLSEEAWDEKPRINS